MEGEPMTRTDIVHVNFVDHLAVAEDSATDFILCWSSNFGITPSQVGASGNLIELSAWWVLVFSVAM